MTSKVVGTIWVCNTCMFAHANGIDMRYESEHGMDYDPETNPSPEPEPWAIEDGDVTMGLLHSEHADGCHVKITDGKDRDECGCEKRESSTSSCDGCGKHSHGTRHAFAVWA